MRLRMILAAFAVLLTTALVAQTFRGTILGTVTDASGAVVSGATVKVHNVNTGQDRTTQTSADGSYTVSELQIGTYDRHDFAERISDLGDQQRGSRCCRRASRGCCSQARTSDGEGGSFGREPASGGDYDQ